MVYISIKRSGTYQQATLGFYIVLLGAEVGLQLPHWTTKALDCQAHKVRDFPVKEELGATVRHSGVLSPTVSTVWTEARQPVRHRAVIGPAVRVTTIQLVESSVPSHPF